MSTSTSGGAHDPLIGRTVAGKYTLLQRLGQGANGVVYRCEHALLSNRNLAIKLLHPELSASPRVRARFLREGEVLLGLHHPSIVGLRDLGVTEDGQLYLCLDFCEGIPLSELLARRGALRPTEALQLAEQLLEGLAVAHRAGVVHRDLKPENMIIGIDAQDQLTLRILDFGIAALAAGDDHGDLTQGMIVGTPRYMSPEQAWGQTIDARSDLYTAGLLLYEMLVGGPAVQGATTEELLTKQRAARIPPLRDRMVAHPWRSQLSALLRRVLTRRPEDRIARVDDFCQQLRWIRSGVPTARARGVRWMAAAVVVLALTSFSIGVWVRPGITNARTVRGGTPGEGAPLGMHQHATPERSDPERFVPQFRGAPQQFTCALCGRISSRAGPCALDGAQMRPLPTPQDPRATPR